MNTPKELCDEKHKSINKRLENLEKLHGEIHNMAISIRENVLETKRMREEINNIVPRIEILENKPVKRYEKIVDAIILIVLGAIIGFVLTKIGL